MASTETTPSPPEILTMDKVLERAWRGKERLMKAGLPTTRDNARRLAWKRARGIDTTVEERRRALDTR